MSKSFNNTKNNHFVPKFYLKSFLNSDNSLFMKDLKTHKIHPKKQSDLKKVASKKNLYSIQDKISSSDIDAFEKIFSAQKPEQTSKNEIRQEFIYTLVAFLNDEMKNLFQIKIGGQQDIENKLNSFLESKINNDEISRNQETLITMHENDFINVYKDILKSKQLPQLNDFSHLPFQDFSLYIAAKIYDLVYKQLGKKTIEGTNIPCPADIEKMQKNAYFDFLHYLLLQYFRTELRLRPPDLKDIENNNFSVNNIMFLLLQYQSIEITYGLINDGYKLVLIKNNSCTDFITSDNPCVNTYYYIQKELNRCLERDEFEIYFPLSPKLAILYTKRNCYNESFEVTQQSDAQFWNNIIKYSTDRYLYSNSKIF